MNNTNMSQQQVYMSSNESAQDQQDYKIKMHQLSFIVNKLEILHQDNMEYLSAIMQAKDSLARKDIQTCASIAQKMIYDTKVSNEVKKAHEEIVNDAKQIGLNLSSKLNMISNNNNLQPESNNMYPVMYE